MSGAVKTMFLVRTVIFGAFLLHVAAGDATIVENTGNVTTIVEETANLTKEVDDLEVNVTSSTIPTEEKLNVTSTVISKLQGEPNSLKVLAERTKVAGNVPKLQTGGSRVKTERLNNIIRAINARQEPFVRNQPDLTQPLHINPVNAPVVVLYNNYPAIRDTEPSFSVLDLHQPNKATDYISARKILDGPIIVAVPLHTGTLATFFVKRGLRSIKQVSSLGLIHDFIAERPPKIGLTTSAAATLRLRPNFASWPVQNIVFSSAMTLSDIAVNMTTHPTLLLVPETSFEPDTVNKDIYVVARFTMLEDLILFEEPSGKL